MNSGQALRKVAPGIDVESYLRGTIRTIPDYPKVGIQFRDVTTLIADAEAFELTLATMEEEWTGQGITHVAGMEARGFIFGAALAPRLQAGFIPIRKPGKLPGKTLAEEYSLEYGTDRLEIHEDALGENHKVLIVDDLIATGGTALAAVRLVQKLGAELAGAAFVIDLPDLGGADKLCALDLKVKSLVSFLGH